MALNKTPVSRGAKGLVEDEDSPNYQEDAQGATITRTYQGPYAECMAKRPQIGAKIAGFNASKVTKVEVKRSAGGLGVLVVTGEETKDSSPGGNQQTQPTQYEIDWGRVDRSLALHPKFSSLSKEDIKKIEAYVQDVSDSGGGAYTGPTTPAAVKYLTLRMKGTESYMVFSPIIRATTPYASPPTTGTAGKKSTPPISVSGFEFIKSADGARKYAGEWQRIEEWTGVDEVDDFLYGDATA